MSATTFREAIRWRLPAAVLAGLLLVAVTPASRAQQPLRLVLRDLPGAVLSLTGTGPHDVWAVGADPGDGIGPLVLHHDGTVWRRLRPHVTGDLWWISERPVGGRYFLAGEGGLILELDPENGTFRTHTTPGTALLFGIWGAAEDDIWAVGGDLADEERGGVVWHYDGTAWAPDERPRSAVPEGLPTLYKVWGRAADDVWVVGRRGVALHFDGSSWQRIATPEETPLFTVHGNSSVVAASGGSIRGRIVELQNQAFTDVAPSGMLQLNGIHIAGDGSGLAVGIAGEYATRDAAGSWTAAPPADTPLDFHAAWIDPEGGLWASGGDLSTGLSSGMIAYAGNAAVATEVLLDPPCPPGRAVTDPTVRFSRDIVPLFERHGCMDAFCHGGGVVASRYDLRTYEGVFGPGAEAESLGACNVVPGDPDASFLLEKLGPSPRIGARMPNGRPPLAADELDLLRAWIAEGAPLDVEATPTPTPTPAPTPSPAPCPCDCDGNGTVSVGELTSGVRIALGIEAAATCPAADADGDGRVDISDLIRGVRADLEGCPSTVGPTPTPAENRPPEVLPPAVYRTYPGFPIRVSLSAVDPDGDSLTFEAAEMPEGAALDPETGVFSWTPAADQTGAWEIVVRITDSGSPPAWTEIVLPVRVDVLDACIVPDCDPETGCQAELVSLAQSCCSAEPQERVPEPAAACPGGLVAYTGRNERGFGRMQNCDRLRILTFAQGGANVRFHVEARCLDAAAPVELHARLATNDLVLFDRTGTVELQEREDGFAQALALVYGIDPGFPLVELEGKEAELAVTLTDRGGTTVSRRLRVILTLEELADLPEPDIEDVPAGEAGCVGCHRPLGEDGRRHGIEEAHPWVSLTCTDCHGGNASATTRSAAHVSPGDGPAYLRDLASDQLDAVPPDYLRFVNPGDFRVIDQTCGRTGCHVEYARNVPLSTMSTFAAHYTLPRYLAGMQGRTGEVAAVDVFDPDFDPETAPPGALQSLRALRGPDPATERATIAATLDEYLPKSCPTCHLNSFGLNNATGNYRSSGCTACHMLYADDGLSRSADPVIRKEFPPHPVTHELTTVMPVEQCAHCHFQGGRIGLAFRGIREGGFSPDRTPPNAVSLGIPLHAHDADYYFADEDSTNAIDETPPDLHFSAGMVCVDCHVGGDVHGDGNLYQSERLQVGIRCQDCHGTVRSEVREDPQTGQFTNSKGFPLRRLRRADDGRILLRLALTGREIEVPQIHRILESGRNPFMVEAMGVNERGFSHTDALECYTCHTSWRQTCLGCHVTLDDRRTARNYTTGEVTRGGIEVKRDDYSLDFFALGVNERGKITPLCSSMSMFFSYVDENGTTHFSDRVRTSGDGRIGFGWNPFHHHTVSRVPQNCDRCHPVDPSLGRDNSALLRETYGFGTGRYMARDGDGRLYDLTAFLDEEGRLISDFPHPNTGPVPADVRERALAVTVVPQPR